MKHTVAPSREGEQREEPQSMRSFIGCDAHRKYSVFVGIDEKGRATAPMRVEHERKELRLFLRHIPPGTDVAVEATGSWYWLVDEIEAAGLVAHLAHPFAAKRMVGGRRQENR